MTLRIILLAVFLGILVLTGILGYKKGFLKQLLEMSALIMALVFAYLFSPYITHMIDMYTGLHDKVEQSVTERVDAFLDEKGAATVDQIEQVLSDSFLPKVLVEKFAAKMQEAGGGGTRKEYVARLGAYSADLTLKVCGIIATFIVFYIIFLVVMFAVGMLDKVPVVSGVNKTLGLILGLVRGLIILWLLCGVITITAHTELGQQITAAISDDPILSAFYNGALSFSAVFGGSTTA